MRELQIACLAIVVGCVCSSCSGDDDEQSGICVADYGIVVECFDCWERSLCEESSSRTWIEGQDSCPSAGYSVPSANECGYTH